jgi:acetate kinase
VELDFAKNASPAMDCDIAAPGSRVRVVVLHAEEDWEIARECWGLMKAQGAAIYPLGRS